MSVCATPAGVKYIFASLLQESSMSLYKTPAESSKSMYDSCRSQDSPSMTPAGVKYVSMYDSCRSQVCHSSISMYDSCRSQLFQL